MSEAQDNVLQRVQRIVRSQLGIDYSLPESRLAADLMADSLDVIEIAMDLEDEFDIEVLDDEIRVTSTVQDVVDLVRNKRKA